MTEAPATPLRSRRFKVLSTAAGALVGPRGETLNAIRKDCPEVKISFSMIVVDGGRLLTLTGGDIRKAVRSVEAVIGHQNLIDLSQSSFSPGAMRVPPRRTHQKTIQEVRVLSAVAGSLLGIEGCALKMLRKQCSDVSIFLENKDIDGWRTIRVAGDNEAKIAFAIQLIEETAVCDTFAACKRQRFDLSAHWTCTFCEEINTCSRSACNCCDRPRPLSLNASVGVLPQRAEYILKNGVVHLKCPFVPVQVGDVESELSQVRPWTTHSQAEPGALCHRIRTELAKLFAVERIVAHRVNIYQPFEGKPAHRDRNAYHSNAGNVTICMSFGAPRTLRFRYLDQREEYFDIYQADGDIVGFNQTVNKAFSHELLTGPGKRISIVIWGYIEGAGSSWVDGLPLEHLKFHKPIPSG